MNLRSLAASLSVAAGLGFLASTQGATAQPAVADLNVSGLKLGMTEDQARAVLLQHDPAMKVTVIYGYQNHDGVILRQAKSALDPSEHLPASAVPVGLLEVSLSHTYGNDSQEVVGNSSKPITAISGEWFILEFAPNDGGGALYAVARTVQYPQPGVVDAASLPDAASFRDKVLAAFGKPTSNNDPDFDWMYDVRGRQLGDQDREHRRCYVSPIFGYRDPLKALQERPSDFTRTDLDLALSDVDHKLSPNDQMRISYLFDELYNYAPNLDGIQQSSQFRQCGVDLQVNLEDNDRVHLNSFTIFLADLNRTYFDNGLQKYFASKAPAVAAAPVPKL